MAHTTAVAQTVTDGDTLKLAGTTYRLLGIDAAEARQACADGWPAGRIASEYMVELVRGRASQRQLIATAGRWLCAAPTAWISVRPW